MFTFWFFLLKETFIFQGLDALNLLTLLLTLSQDHPEMLPEHRLKNCKALEHTYQISILQPSDARDGLPCGHTRPVEITAYIHLCVIDVFYPLRKCLKVKDIENCQMQVNIHHYLKRTNITLSWSSSRKYIKYSLCHKINDRVSEIVFLQVSR